ncbi:uncharacterized protein GIQ15_04851 [Arthroderma uncinatum]|uniref:uncharacterized protein n=1 Tax=Arthroderma uncinatum TaxID=74035 RepID=UPI00144AA79A|nr:uncharacterized protein GIQ15_04851 [Arthroderma uncinatum]KAF3482092.1 hypothetical protein GIQ15_04851 [Arthroderma uncinatum]
MPTMDEITSSEPGDLFHVIFTTSHIQKDPRGEMEKVRIPGTYTSIGAAKAAAHSCLFDAGYEREWFSKYETNPEVFESLGIRQRAGLAVFATAPDGTTFRVRIHTTPNVNHLTTSYEDGRIPVDLYYVVQANVEYADGQGGELRDINIEGTFKSYDEARDFARGVLLSEEDGISKQSFAQYDEAGPNERDCGYGENVIVHAEMESVRLAEATMKIS